MNSYFSGLDAVLKIWYGFLFAVAIFLVVVGVLLGKYLL